MDADAYSQDMEFAAELMQSTAKPCRTIILWFTLTTLWLILTSFTLTGFVMAFFDDIMFRFSFIAFSCFITTISLPFILRPILKSFSLYHQDMDKFSNKCVYLLNRLMYIVFVWLTGITTFLLIVDNEGRYWSACFIIGIHNVILAFKLGSFLSFRVSSTQFHGFHFFMLCLSIAAAIYLNNNDTENGMLIFGPIVIYVVELCILVLVQSSMRRKQREYVEEEKRRDRIRTKQKQKQRKKQVIELCDIDVDVPRVDHGPSSGASSPDSPYSNAVAPPKMLSLRLNRDRTTEEDLFSLHEGADDTALVDRVRVYSDATRTKQTEKLRYKQYRHVTCCCSKLICGLRTCLQIQTIVTAASIWGSFALFLLNKISWTCYALMIFISATTIYNPICYTKRCFAIRQQKSCCTTDKCGLCCAYFFGLIVVLIAAGLCGLLFIIANPFAQGNIDDAVIDMDDRIDAWWTLDLVSAEFKLRLMYSVWGIATLSFLNYLPGAGWVFYQTPVAFAFINFLSFMVFLMVPMILNNAFNTASNPCIDDEDFTCDIQNNSVNHLYDFLYNGYKKRMENDPDDATLLYIPHLTALISFTIYLSLTGLGCSWYRFKKAIVESQAKLTGQEKGQQSKDFGMTLIMSMTLSLAFGDVISDAIYAFGTKDQDWASPSLKWLTISLFCMQILIQIFSFNDVINQLRKSLAKQKSLPGCGWCYHHCTLCYMVLTLPYLVIVFLIGIVLGLTKLFSIKQVQEWWFKLLISGYGKEVEKAKERQKWDDAVNVNDIELCVDDKEKEKELELGQQMAIASESVENGAWECTNCRQYNEETYVTCSGCYVDRDKVGMPPTVASMNAPMMNEGEWNTDQNMNVDLDTFLDDDYQPMGDAQMNNDAQGTEENESTSSSQNITMDPTTAVVNAQTVTHSENVENVNVSNTNQKHENANAVDPDVNVDQNMGKDKDKDMDYTMDNPWSNADDIHIEVQQNKESNDIQKRHEIVRDTDTNTNAHNPIKESNTNVDEVRSIPNADISKLKTNIAAEPINVDDCDEDLPTPVRGHNNKQSTQFENIVTMVYTKSAKQLPGMEEQHFKVDLEKKKPQKIWNDFQLKSMKSQSVRSFKPSASSMVNSQSVRNFKPSASSTEVTSQSVRNFNAVISKEEEDISGHTVQTEKTFTHYEPLKKSPLQMMQSQSVRSFKPRPRIQYPAVKSLSKSKSLEQDNAEQRGRAHTERTFKQHEPLNEVPSKQLMQSQSVSAAAGGRIRDITTPKMAKFRAKFDDVQSTVQNEESPDNPDNPDNPDSDGVILYDDDDAKTEDDIKQSKDKKDRRANILDEDGQWLGYEISSNSPLWKIYLWIDSFTPLWMSRLKVRANVYNSYFISELIIESWPQLVTNLVNSYYQGFSLISYISAAFSLLMISHTMLKIIYYVGVRNKNLDKFVL